jgi:uncharacterized protein (TIGR03086 family)
VAGSAPSSFLDVELFDALRTSREEFEVRLALVGDGDWGRPTPCSEWNVRALVNHVIGGCARYTRLLHGASAAEVQAMRASAHDHVGEDAAASFRPLADEMMAAFGEPGALSRTVHHPAGDRPGRALADMRAGDFAVHAWDLARAIGADEALDPALVEWCLVMVSGMGEELSKGGYFQAPRGETSADATAQDRLLHLLGRAP